ncbi:MAG: GNAT family N-acetyltransferase [Alistipes finegoldii]
MTEQFRTGALMLWGAFRQDTLAGVAAVRNHSHISLLFVDASCHRQGIARALFSAVRDFCSTIRRFPASPSTRRPMPSKYTADWIHRNRRRTRHGRNPFYSDDIPIITAAAADAPPMPAQ